MAQQVTNANDNGPGSLRAAIANAAPGDVITFAPTLRNQAIQLDSALIIGQDLTLIGPDAELDSTLQLRGDATQGQGIFTVNAGVRFRVERLALVQGIRFGAGGAVWANGAQQVVVRTCRFTACLSLPNLGLASRGGAVFLANSVETDSILHCQFSSNEATWGGDVYANGSWYVSHCRAVGNFLFGDSGNSLVPRGGSFYNAGTLHLRHTSVEEGRAITEAPADSMLGNLAQGVGLYNAAGAQARLDTCQWLGLSCDQGAGVAVFNATAARLQATGCRFQGNTADVAFGLGGAIYCDSASTLQLDACLLDDNSLPQGRGGALYLAAAVRAELVNCTFTQNYAGNPGRGGAIYHDSDSTVRLVHCTVVRNRTDTRDSSSGGGMYLTARALAVLSHCLFASNTGTDFDIGLVDQTSRLVSAGYNLIDRTAWDTQPQFPAATDQIALGLGSTRLEPLQQYGGILPMVGLGTFSVAVDVGDPNDTLLTDARGLPRRGRSDIGAYERQEVEIQAPEAVLCPNSDTVTLGPLVIRDETGGAILPGEDQVLILLLPEGVEFVPGEGIPFELGSGTSLIGGLINSEVVIVIYDRDTTLGEQGFLIDSLRVFANGDRVSDTLVMTRFSGTVRMLGNELADTLATDTGLQVLRPQVHARFVLGAGPKPIPTFDATNTCRGDSILLTSRNAGAGTLAYWRWRDENGIRLGQGPTLRLASDSLPRFFYPTLTTGPDSLCAVDTTQEVIISPRETLTADPTLYDFDGAESLWIQGAPDQRWSWERQTPVGRQLDGAPSPPNAWVTALQGDSSRYDTGEFSFVVSPCFDLTRLTRPMVSLDLNYDLDPDFHGVALQYTLDDGANWRTLGTPTGATTSTGLNWYAPNGIFVSLGDADGRRFGWSGSSQGWQRSALRLDERLGDTLTSLQLRIVLESDANMEQPYEGFAFDNFYLGDRQDFVLVEAFAQGQDTPQVAEALRQDVVWVTYDQSDPRYDLAARGLYYGNDGGPLRIADGRLLSADTATQQIRLASLKTAAFDIAIDSLTARVRIRPLTNVAEPLQVFVTTLEPRAFPIPGLATYDAVNMLPSPAGRSFPEGMEADLVYLTTAHQDSALYPIPADAPLGAEAQVLVVVQHALTREVLQVHLAPAPAASRGARLGRPAPAPEALGLRFYPNPTPDWLYVRLPVVPENAPRWALYDLSGRQMDQGPLKAGQALGRLSLRAYPPGSYLLRVAAAGQQWEQVVQRR